LNDVSGLNEAYQQYKKYISSCEEQLKDSGTSSGNEVISSTTLSEPILTQISSTLSGPSRSSETGRVEENNIGEYQELVTTSPSCSKVNS